MNKLILIPNPGIVNHRVKLLPYSFTPVHISEKTNVIPDTLSHTEPVDMDPSPQGRIPRTYPRIPREHSETQNLRTS